MVCSMRTMPRVVMLSTWVSPRSNRPEPCARGRMPTSAESGRMSRGPRPSMRLASLTTRWRTSSLVRLRKAAETSRSRPAKASPSWPLAASTASALRASRRSCRWFLSAMAMASRVAASTAPLTIPATSSP